jgi:hypothetical protein
MEGLMSWQTTINLQPHFFERAEFALAEFGELTAHTFRYQSGVCGLRLTNGVGRMILLPYKGQQIWRLELNGREITMKSMFDEPTASSEYLHTYGGFLLHCGFATMGVPTEKDTHPLHGELPNAPYQTAQLLIGEDEKGPYMGLTGTYQYTVAFNYNYVARPTVRLHAGSARVPISMVVKNLKRTPMEYMYLAHVNFRLVDNGRLVYSAQCTPEHVRIRSSIPSHVRPAPGYREFLAELAQHPERHNTLKPGLAFDPEVVLFVDYLADKNGWAHTMQVHPDRSADFISHRPGELDHGVRWIARTPDQDAIGLVLPATAEPEGYTAEKAKGNIKVLSALGEFRCEMEIGVLVPPEADRMEQEINRIVAG